MTKPSICLYFHVHQPTRLNRHSVFDKSHRSKNNPMDAYFDHNLDKFYFQKIAKQCYLPANKIISELIEESDGKFKVSFSITGVWIEQCKKYAPEVLESFKKLVKTGSVEIVDETYYHSLSSLWWDQAEFKNQVKKHSDLITETFGGQAPKTFRNTELLVNDNIISNVDSIGRYTGMLAEGIERVLGWRSPNYIYSHKNNSVKMLFRNYRLSDDIGFRFSDRGWKQWPLTADKYVDWLNNSEGQTINLFMDYETVREHHWPGSGNMEFLYWFAKKSTENGLEFKTTSQTVQSYKPISSVEINGTVSWADMERDASAWLGNKTQDYAFSTYWELENGANELGGNYLDAWRTLGVSDHYMYLCLKSWSDGDVHKHFSPYKDWTPYDNFINYMNILSDLSRRMNEQLDKPKIETTIKMPTFPAIPEIN